MRTTLFAAAFVAMLGTAQARPIDFSGFSDGDVFDDPVTIDGVTFTDIGGLFRIIDASAGSFCFDRVVTEQVTLNCAAAGTIRFEQPIESVSFDILATNGTTNSGAFIFTQRDDGEDDIGTVFRAIDGASYSFEYTEFFPGDQLISAVFLTIPLSGDDVRFGNFDLGPASEVPLPAAAWLFLAGAGLAVSYRKRRG